ncbi:MAG: threonyl-tRNA synthetase [Flavobacteriaceae bacterium]|jgi:threonyl-tRNA synthetase
MEQKILEQKRHTLAHLLAQAVVAHYPDVHLTLGPAIENGFYYDIDFGDKQISDKDLKTFQKTMRKSLSKWKEFTHETISCDKAKEYYKGNPYKTELIEGIEERGEDITLYTCGGFTDLCRGGHTEHPSEEISADSFKLESVAGAYWRGDENNPMLTRIYGLAFNTKEELDAHVSMQEEAKKRDHRKLGAELDLFTFSPLVGSGLPLFTPRGTAMRDAIINKIQNIQKDLGYSRVSIPHITKKDLYETSGHWDKFGDELFKVKGQSDTQFVMKPMNCPHHTQIFASQARSYKDLPLRYMESTMVYRDEQQGELLGLARVRSITQDDGHVFCTEDQIEQEVRNIIFVIKELYTALDMWNEETYWVSLSVRDPQTPEKYLGEDSLWDMAEETLEKIALSEGLNFKRVEGEAAFYGPKLDFMFQDALGRERQLGTAQLDFVMPSRFSLEYTDNTGSKQTPVMIHRAIAGSLERFMAIVIEHFAGEFPFWLSPVQISIIPVQDSHSEYAKKVRDALYGEGFRAEAELGDDGMGKKVRKVKNMKTPYRIIIGDEEASSGKLTLETLNDTKETYTLDELIEKLKTEM